MMKKIILLMLTCILLSSCGNAQNTGVKSADGSTQLTYEEWQKAAQSEIRLNPKYGKAQKTADQKVADQELINSYVSQTGSRHNGSDTLIKIGFKYLYNGNTRTAMYRFNQAWLLDSTNADVFWGFSAVYFTYKDTKKAMDMLEEGLKINPRSAHLITDKASIYLTKFYSDKDQQDLFKAIMILQESYEIDPLYDNTLFKLSICYFLKQDCVNANRYYKECMKVGGRPIPADYSAALKERCK
ncbi:tetratricopeptide (TPR) repeat protein [Pedobacter sp. UYP24]